MSENSWAQEIRKILAERGLSQNGLADALDVDPSVVSQYLSGKRQPGNLTCLSFATLACDGSRAYWLGLSGLTRKQLEQIGRALAITAEPAASTSDEHELLDWWRDPRLDVVSQSIRDVVDQLLTMRRAGRK